ncbi:unnamed protein product [Rotaria sp. Silwood1]|nr:unnamed protein product [Rotaria sp. Silwood1]CAF3625868.1 unnamed protein product [Rotaria sp. Silwood1]CAF4528497.1 unnamed protein product [Rotaria sp. Silwood1]
MLSVLFELFLITINIIPLLSSMNILKGSLFSSSNKKKLKKPSQNLVGKYKFRQANNSLTDPLLYTFNNTDIELGTINSDDESKSNDDHIVRTRSSRPNLISLAHDGGSIVIMEKPTLPSETIQAFAIRYRVPVSQLKRLNNLQNDQDFYALTHCRVPVHRFGLLHESSESLSTTVDSNEQSTISLPVTHLSQQNHLAFLNAMDQDLASMRAKVERLIETSSTTTTTALISNQLTSPSLAESMIKPVKNTTTQFNCDEADCGCRFSHIIIVAILIALIPLICAYFYIKYYSTIKNL